jgi:hypothetical protein
VINFIKNKLKKLVFLGNEMDRHEKMWNATRWRIKMMLGKETSQGRLLVKIKVDKSLKMCHCI